MIHAEVLLAKKKIEITLCLTKQMNIMYKNDVMALWLGVKNRTNLQWIIVSKRTEQGSGSKMVLILFINILLQ